MSKAEAAALKDAEAGAGSSSVSVSGFEGSYLGDNSKLSDDTVMECKICWHHYHPTLGDDYWQIPPGTPFSALPDHWRCPECDSDKTQFMQVLEP